jgi:protein ImuA
MTRSDVEHFMNINHFTDNSRHEFNHMPLPMPGHDDFPHPDPALIAELHACIHRLGGCRQPEGQPEHAFLPLSTGVKALDDALPWGGLPRAGLHEVIAADNGVAAGGFCAALLARLIEAGDRESGMEGNRLPNQGTANQGTALWCRRGRGLYGPGLYGPGLAPFGLDPARLIIVHARTDSDLFWAMEEALRSGALVGVLGEIAAAHPTALRRLQLAAESHGTMALLLRPHGTVAGSAPAVTRWRVGAMPGVPPVSNALADAETDAGTDAMAEAVAPGAPGAPRRVRCCWQVELLRCKSGLAGFGAPRQEAADAGVAARQAVNRAVRWPATWRVECDETNRLAVAAALCDRSVDPAARTRAKA